MCSGLRADGMNRRSNKDRRTVNYRVLTDATERRKTLDRRNDGLSVYELNVSDDAFAHIFQKYSTNKKD